MDMDQLRTFISIAHRQSFSGAAEELHLTQPAVSKRLAALEAELGAPLVDRLNRALRLTQAGAALLPRAEHILLEAEHAKKAVQDITGGVRGELRLATSHHLGLHKLPPVLREFCARFPEVNLQIEFLDSEIALERVTKGQCELGVITLPPVHDDHLQAQRLWLDPLVFVTHPGSPLGEVTELAILSREAAILPDLHTYTGRLIKATFQQLNLPLEVNMATNYLETIKMMVSVGLGWSLLPTSMLDEQLLRVPIADVHLSRELGVVTHRKRTMTNAAVAFYDLLRANAADVITA